MISLIQKIRQRGVLNSFEIVFNRIIPVWLFRFSVGDVLELDVDRLRDKHTQAEPDTLRFERVTEPTRRANLRAVTWNSVPEATTHEDMGYAITTVDDAHTIVGGVWCARDSFMENNLGFRIALAANQGWIYCAYVSTSLRGMGAYQRLLAFATHDVKPRGYDRLLVVIQPWNKASMHVHQKYSHHKVGRIVVIRILRLCLVFGTGGLTQEKYWTTRSFESPVVFEIA
ncbi:Acetyltransferase (GNAT) family protein [Neorhodopirellula lusitana]|uniref:Acetyltransferase (GNAT) family protein n=1 Tax=Neorhodopirellula lusitana TaxID=445327 RepID=A0ABY1PRH8_9BACT|nr:GNAT family N-acetyltransferase [Neorhodopirellula lusitana]SMP42119.1 Acetyltransferase (GNAT) family protein [Neorhodopirellula lusitana]